MAIEERKSQLVFEATDNTKPGVESVKEGLQGISGAADEVARKSSAALDQVAKAGTDAGQQLDRSTASISSSIKRVISDTQRQIATLKAEASGGGSADVFENLISQRGANAEALKPLIGNLRTLRTELDTLRQAEQRRSVDINYEREKAAAEQARRRADATAALTQVIEQQEAAERRLAGQNSFVQSLKAQSDAIGKTKADLLELQAAQMGVSAQAAPYIAKLREQEQALGQNGKVLNAYGQTAKQTTAALRQVPAQITDIVVSLQGGQAPLTVLLQQGGQLKDVFGGVVPALRGVAQGVLGLVNPYTLTAAALGAVALAYYQGSQEADAYNRSIVLTGNQAGVTAGQLQASAAAISKTVGTQSAAAAVLAQIAESGKVAGDNMQRFAEVTLKAERDLGISSQEMVKNFAALGESPVEASLKLTKQYGYLTLATLEQIKALQDQNRSQEAAALSQEAYATAMDTRAAQLRTQLGTIERAWQAVASSAKKGWDAILDVGRPTTYEERLENLRVRVANKRTNLDSYKDTRAGQIVQQEIDALLEQIAGLEELTRNQRLSAEQEAERQRIQREGADAFDAVTKAQEKGLTKQQQLNKALDEYDRRLKAIRAANPDSSALKPEAVERGRQAIRDQFKERDTGTRGAEGRQAELADLQAKIKAADDYTQRLREQGIEAEKNNQGAKLSDSIQTQLNGTLSKTTREFLEQKLALAKQWEESERVKDTEVKRQKAIEKSVEAVRKQVQTVYDEASATEQQRIKLDEVTGAYGRSAIAVAKLAVERTKLRLAEAEGSDSFDPAYVENLRRLLAEQQKNVGSVAVAEYEKVNRVIEEQTNQALEQNMLIQEEINLLGLSEVERKKIVAAREVELKLAKELRDIEKLGLGEAETEELKAKKRDEYRVKAANAGNKVILDDWQKTTDQINQSLTDALMRGFESGKGFGETLRDTLVNMFKTMVLRPTVSAILSPISSAVGGVVNNVLGGGAGGPSILGLASNASTAYSAYNGITTGQGIYGSIGSWFGLGSGTGAGASATAVNGLSALQPVTIGTNTAKVASVQAGAPGGVGFGPVAAYAAVAALLANAFGAFSEKTRADSGLAGTLGQGSLSAFDTWRTGGTLFKGPSYDYRNPEEMIAAYEKQVVDAKAKGASEEYIFSIQSEVDSLKKLYGETIKNTKTQSDSIQKAYDALRKNVGGMADVLGIGSESVRNFTMALGKDVINSETGALGLSFKGLTQEEINKKITEALDTANNTLAEQILGTWETVTRTFTDRVVNQDSGPGDQQADYAPTFVTRTETTTSYVASEFAREGEKAIDTLTRLATSFATVKDIAADMRVSFDQTGLAGANAASEIVDAFGGLEAIASQFSSYIDNYYSEAEKRENLARRASQALQTAGLSVAQEQILNATRPVVRGFVEAVLAEFGPTSEQYIAVIQQANVLAQIYEPLDDAGGAAKTLADRLRDAVESASDLAKRLTDAANARDTAGNLMDRLAGAAGYEGREYENIRKARLWGELAVAPWDRQIELAGELTDIVLNRYQAEKEAAEKQATLAKNLRDYIKSITVGDLSPLTAGEKLAEAQRQAYDTYAAALRGDEDAQSQLQDKATTYLELARTYYASGQQYTDIFNEVTQALGGFSDSLEASATGAKEGQSMDEMRKLYDTLTKAYQLADAETAKQTDLLADQLTLLARMQGGVEEINKLLAGLPADVSGPVGRGTVDKTAQAYVDLMAQVGIQGNAANISQQFSTGTASDLQAGYAASMAALQTAEQKALLEKLWLAVKQYRGIDGSHAQGLASVPFDGYRAELHRGERVLTAAESRAYQPRYEAYSRPSDQAFQAISAELRALRADNERLTQQLAQVIAASGQANAERVVQGVGTATERASYGRQLEAGAKLK